MLPAMLTSMLTWYSSVKRAGLADQQKTVEVLQLLCADLPVLHTLHSDLLAVPRHVRVNLAQLKTSSCSCMAHLHAFGQLSFFPAHVEVARVDCLTINMQHQTQAGHVQHVMSTTHCLQVLDEVAPESDPTAMQEAEPEAADLASAEKKQKLLYCERFVEFLTDLLSQLPTRRFIRTLLEDRAILTKCRMSALFQHPQGETVVQTCLVALCTVKILCQYVHEGFCDLVHSLLHVLLLMLVEKARRQPQRTLP